MFNTKHCSLILSCRQGGGGEEGEGGQEGEGEAEEGEGKKEEGEGEEEEGGAAKEAKGGAHHGAPQVHLRGRGRGPPEAARGRGLRIQVHNGGGI